MVLWKSDRLRSGEFDNWLDAQTKLGDSMHAGGINRDLLEKHLDIPSGVADVWLELHDRRAADRLEVTVRHDDLDMWWLWLEGEAWMNVTPGEHRLLRRLGLIGGKRDCLWLEVWYREV